ncbi:MAG: Veg family protein [Caldicoprobacterales bacterium]|nr:Veg protein [Clostridiales bacterium]
MIDAEALARIRKAVESNVGQKVRLKANRGRRKTYIKEGVISDTYLNLFTVRVDIDTRCVQTLSYTYSDILTSNVELVKCSDNEKICTV